MEDAKKVLDNLKSSGIESLVISGGEPFLHNELLDILQYAKEGLKIKNVICISNGTANIDKYISISKYIDKLAFSIDGYNEDTCVIRDKEIFNIIDKKIDALKNNINISLIFTVHKRNFLNPEKYVEYANSKGVTYNFSILTVHSNYVNNYSNLCFEDSDYDIMRDVFTDYEVTDSSISKQLSCKVSCGAGKTMVSILSDGSIMPCHMFFDKKFCLGNSLKDKIIDVVNSDINPFKNLTVECIDDCKSCNYKLLCGGGCRFRSYALTDSIYEKDALCQTYIRHTEKIFNLIFNLKVQ